MDQDQQTQTGTGAASELVVENLVEEVSIDGMCGVY
ncbi:MAG: mycofactocin precursor MftA [Mycobacterium sp.]